MNLLIIDQGSAGAALLAQRLFASGFRPERFTSAQAALASRIRDSAAAVLIDQGVAAPAAATTVMALRRQGIGQPVIVIAARDDWRERVAALEAGADDFLVKPVRSEEVSARLHAAIRRTIGPGSERILAGDLEVDLKGSCAWRAGRCLDLTRNEFRLLQFLLRSAEGAVTQRDIAAAVWPDRPDTTRNAVEVLVGRLRAKLGADRIRTVRNVGYRMVMATAPCAPPSGEPCRKDPAGVV